MGNPVLGSSGHWSVCENANPPGREQVDFHLGIAAMRNERLAVFVQFEFLRGMHQPLELGRLGRLQIVDDADQRGANQHDVATESSSSRSP